MVDPMLKRISFRAALFDMDGTLVDSTALVESEWGTWAEANSLNPLEVIKAAHGRRTDDVIREFLPAANTAIELNRFISNAVSLDQSVVRPVLGAVEFVRDLDLGSWGVVTSAPYEIARKRLLACGFPLPEVLISADRVRRGKPDPEGYLSAARSLGQVPSSCLVFEDAPAGVAAAQNAGMPVVALMTTYPNETFEGCTRVADFRQIQMTRDRDGWISVRILE